MSKYSTQFKSTAVQDYLKGGSLKRVAELYQVDHSDLRKWVLAYQTHGLASLQKRAYQHYRPEFKLAVLRSMKLHQISARLAAAHFNIASPSTIRVWQRLYNEGGLAALQAKPKGRASMSASKPFKPYIPSDKPVAQMTPEELMQELEYRRVETDYLKKLEALAQKKYLAGKNKSR